MEKRYYLNNTSDEVMSIKLTADRTIPAKTSLPLNNKDVEIFKKLRDARKGKHSKLDCLKLSTIKIEEDSNYTKEDKVVAETSAKENEEALKAQAELAAKEAEEQAAKEKATQGLLERLAKEEAEKAAKEAEEQAAKEAEEQAVKEKAKGFAEKLAEKFGMKTEELDQSESEEVKAALDANPEVKAFLEGETDKLPEGTEEFEI